MPPPGDKHLEQGPLIVRTGNLEMYKGMRIVDLPTSPITLACALHGNLPPHAMSA